MQNKYEVIGVVGEGAYGIVYKCRNKETKDYVAIKKFKETEDDLVKKTMKRELKVLQMLKHENIVEFKEAFKRKNDLFLVFEYVDRNLLELLQEKPSGLDPNLIRTIIYQLCKAINYLHNENIIHRDVKPENLLIDNNMKLKLCDFGFARKVLNNKKENLTDYVATRWYRSPELLITNGIYGIEVDYWAIGCIMGELIDGNPLFPGNNETDQLHCIQKVLGNLPEDQVQQYYENPLYAGKNLLNIKKPETLERRYMGKNVTKSAMSFMKGLLELDPNKRLCSDYINHPYFNCFKEVLNQVSSQQVNQQRDNKKTSSIKHKDINNSIPNISSMPSTTPLPNTNNNQAPGGNSNNQIPPIMNQTNISFINYNHYNNDDNNNNDPSSNIIGQQENIDQHISNNNNIKKVNNQIIVPSKQKNKDKDKDKDKDKANILASMAMTMTNQFPIVFQKQFEKPSQNTFNLSSRQSFESDHPSTTSFNFNNNPFKGNINITSFIPHGQPISQTFYKNKNDKYNFGINTNFANYYSKNNPINYNSSTIDEEAEYKNSNGKKSKSMNHNNHKYNSKLSNNNNNFEGSPREKNKYLHENNSNNYHSNKSNSPYKNTNNNTGNNKHVNYHQSLYAAMPNISCYGNGFQKEKNIFLPQLNKNIYQNNLKKFHQLINK